MQIARNSYRQQLWDQSPETDTRRARARNLLEVREHNSAAAFVKGSRVFAKELLRGQLSPNSREASRQLIERSHKLLAESRRLIMETKNTLAFALVPSNLVN
jgi:hypothetical protein